VHPPKHITSKTGLGLTWTTKVFETFPDHFITDETFGEMERLWSIDDLVVAKPGYRWITKWEEGKNYVITRILNEKGDWVGTYCDICSPVKKIEDTRLIGNDEGFEFEDWYLDVWQPANEKPGLLDEDELEEAVADGHITREQAEVAMEAAAKVIEILGSSAI